jgi:hypothetical protein
MESFIIEQIFIFHPLLKSPLPKPSDDEAQDAKLLYYYPSTEQILVKRSNIGIIEGTLSFMNSFEKTNTSFLLTELNKFYFIANNYEKDFIISFLIQKDLPMFSYYQNINTKKEWFKLLIDNFYDYFCMFHKSLTEFFLDKENSLIKKELTKEKENILEDYIKIYIEFFTKEMKIPFINNLQYFPMSNYLQCEILLNVQKLNEKIKEINMTSILYKGKIIHNQLPFETISLLYNLFYNIFEIKSKFTNFSPPPSENLQNFDNKNEKIKKFYSSNSSPFRKVFALDIKSSECQGFLIGISDNNIFIPDIFIPCLNSTFKFICYYYKGLIFFFMINDITNIYFYKEFNQYIPKYFNEILNNLNEFNKNTYNETSTYVYINSANHSIKFSNFLSKKNKTLEQDKLKMIVKNLFLNDDVKMSSITKFKGNYIYFINSMGRKVCIIYGDGMNLTQVKSEIQKLKKEEFEFVFLI